MIARLHEIGLPPGVRAEDGGSDSLLLPGLWQGEGEVWLVDAGIAGTTTRSLRCRSGTSRRTR